MTVSLGLCLFTFAIASLVGPLAVSDQYKYLRDIYHVVVFVLPRWARYTTPLAHTARASLESAHLGSLVPSLVPPLYLPEKNKYIIGLNYSACKAELGNADQNPNQQREHHQCCTYKCGQHAFSNAHS